MDDAVENDHYGRTIGVSGNHAIVGVSQKDDFGLGALTGAVYFYELIDDEWVQKQKVNASDPSAHSFFGNAVAIDGDYAVVGAAQEDELAFNAGAAYVFEYIDGVWTEIQKLYASDPAMHMIFGSAVALDNERIVIAADGHDQAGFDAGAAYIFDLKEGVWTETAKLMASDGFAGDRFGEEVDLYKDRVIIGARYNDDVEVNSGSVYIYEYNGVVWQESKIIAPDPALNSVFGASVAIGANTAMISAELDDEAGEDSGALYIYEYKYGVWDFVEKLTADDTDSGDQFGNAIELFEGTLLVGAFMHDNPNENNGAIYRFEKIGDQWVEQERLISLDIAANDNFGQSLACTYNYIFVGAPQDDNDGLENPGSVYIFSDIIPCKASESAFSVSECTSYTVPSGDETYTDLGTYEVLDTIMNFCGEDSLMTIEVTIHGLPTIAVADDLSIYSGDTVKISAVIETSGVFSWSPDENMTCASCPETKVWPNETKTYFVSFVDDYGCASSGQVLVNVLEPLIEDKIGISPNGDGLNDLLVFPGLLAYDKSSIQIFNRWGVQVFSAENGYKNDWGGVNQQSGELLPAGSTCFFVLDLGEEGLEPVRGYVYISH